MDKINLIYSFESDCNSEMVEDTLTPCLPKAETFNRNWQQKQLILAVIPIIIIVIMMRHCTDATIT